MSSYYEDPHQNPYWQNLNGNNSQNGRDPGSWDNMNRQNTRNTDPNFHPEQDYGRQLGRTASMFGIFSIVSCFLMPVAFPAIFGGIAIVLAIISKGRNASMTRNAHHAAVLGTIGLTIHLTLFGIVIFSFYQVIHDPAARAQVNQTMEQLYGYSFDDFLQQFEQDYGISPEQDSSEDIQDGSGNNDSGGSESPSENMEPENRQGNGQEAFA